MKYLVVSSRPWNKTVFDSTISNYPGEWVYLDDPRRLTLEYLERIKPRYVLFLHWSWKVPAEIINNCECVCFHMTDVPYGRGGSPLQNLIARGHRRTKLTALRMVEDLDAGPVYLKEDLCLEGNAEEIYIRASYLSARMIRRIIEEQLVPQPQEGEPVVFKRRKPRESRISELSDLQALHDFIRMLDAEGYPKAFLEHGGFRLRPT
jgi:methionyl-tRNA formyltransferase